MPAPDTRFRTYLKAFFSDLLTGMSGPLSVPFVIAALWVSSRTQKTLYAGLAVLCALFASYRVWQKERKDASAQLLQKDSELLVLREQVASLTKSKQKLRLTISVEGDPPSQALKVIADQPVAVTRVAYMTSTEATIAVELIVPDEGELVEIPINDALLLKLWNTPRPDRVQYDHSGPAKLGVLVSADGLIHDFTLPIQMESMIRGSTMYRKITGSKTFQV